MTGYKSKVAQGRWEFEKKPFGWKENLAAWETDGKSKYGYGAGQDIKSDCLDLMQHYYPGEYDLIWSKIAPNVFHLRPVFKTPSHETMWLLKYGDQ